jgi:hypothetical protein
MKKITLILLLYVIAQTLGAENGADGKTDVEISSELVLQVTSLLEVKLGFTEHFCFPFLQGESSLTEDNNVDLALSAEISPVSFNLIAEAVWTPIAFFQLTTGCSIGSGWNIELSGSKIYGIGLNRSNAQGEAEYSGSAFDGLLWKAQAGAVLQFDLAALYPGDWNHIVAQTSHEINYRGYSRAKKGESWYYEGDYGENINGFNYYGNLIIGYQMPLFINTAALMAEADLYLYNTPNRSRWGDDKIRWTFSAITNFAISEKFEITLAAQFITMRNYLNPDWEDMYYRDRNIDSSRPLHLEFDRVAAVLTYRF